ncbi:MAG: hypothetical protein ABIL09_13015 [Gemmatimonadota bacterium]
MGTSTDAIIFYGITLDVEQHPPGCEPWETSWEDYFVAKVLDWQKGDGRIPYEKTKEVLKEYRVKFETHQHHECFVPIICVDESFIRANRGEEMKLDPEKMVLCEGMKQEWDDIIARVVDALMLDHIPCEACEGTGTNGWNGQPCYKCNGRKTRPPVGRPDWYLVSYWG